MKKDLKKDEKYVSYGELIRRISERAKYAKMDVRNIIDALGDELRASVTNGETVKIGSIGRMYSVLVPERRGWVNLKKAWMILPPTRRVTIKLSSTIKNAENSPILSDDEDEDEN